MQSLGFQLKRKLSKLYAELSRELQFNLSLRDIIDKREVWTTDILHFLRYACRHLIAADACAPHVEVHKCHMLQAELIVRHLIESMISEFTELRCQVEPI